METKKKIKVEVAYALPHDQQVLSLEVEEGCTVETAIKLSGILNIFPDINLTKQKVGVFSQSRHLTDKVQDGDRIEIYRPLLIDPKEARRAKARKNIKKSAKNS